MPWRQTKKGRERQNLQCPNVTFCSLCSHYNKISLAEEVSIMYWCCGTSDQDWIKTKIPPLLRKVELEKKKRRKGGVGVKIRKYHSKPLPSQWTFCPLIFTIHITSLLKEFREATHLNVLTFPLRTSYYLLINPLFSWLMCLIS